MMFIVPVLLVARIGIMFIDQNICMYISVQKKGRFEYIGSPSWILFAFSCLALYHAIVLQYVCLVTGVNVGTYMVRRLYIYINMYNLGRERLYDSSYIYVESVVI